MKVPNNDNAVIPPEKIVDYLLSKTHPLGKAKALFFEQIGYTLQNTDLFSKDLHAIIKANSIRSVIETNFGAKYIVKGPIGKRFGKNVVIVTIWIIEEGSSFPRFITAYPDR